MAATSGPGQFCEGQTLCGAQGALWQDGVPQAVLGGGETAGRHQSRRLPRDVVPAGPLEWSDGVRRGRWWGLDRGRESEGHQKGVERLRDGALMAAQFTDVLLGPPSGSAARGGTLDRLGRGVALVHGGEHLDGTRRQLRVAARRGRGG